MDKVLRSSVPSHGQLLLERLGKGQPENVSQKLTLEGSYSESVYNNNHAFGV